MGVMLQGSAWKSRQYAGERRDRGSRRTVLPNMIPVPPARP